MRILSRRRSRSLAAQPARYAGTAARPSLPAPAGRKGRSGYVSEFTLFMGDFLRSHPEVVRDQRRGWEIFWDKKVDLAAIEQARRDGVPVDAYYYFGRPRQRGDGR